MIIVVEVETSVTVEGQTDTQTATVQQGTQGPKGTSYLEEHCPILMYNKDPNLDHSFADWQRPGAGSEALRCRGKAQQGEITRHHRVRLVRSDPKNTGQWAGVAAELEKLLKRVLQRILCLKHMLEILWHYFFKHNEYSIFVLASPEDPQKAPASHLTTSGPSAFKGPE